MEPAESGQLYDPGREEYLARQREIARSKHERQRKNPLSYQTGISLLKAFARYHYLTVAQVERLTGYQTKNYVQTWLKNLSVAGYLYDKNFIAESSMGRPLGVWSLTNKGSEALRRMDYPALVRVPYKLRRDSDWLKHVRDLNDVLMQFERLEAVVPDWRVIGYQHDLELQRTAVQLTLPDGQKRYFVPDGWVALEHDGIEYCYCVEMDRGTERGAGKPWKQKIRSYVAFIQGPYKELIDHEALTGILIAVKSHNESDHNRMENLRRWTREELKALGKEHWAHLFKFTTQYADETDPRIYFGSPVWIDANGTRKEPLLADVL